MAKVENRSGARIRFTVGGRLVVISDGRDDFVNGRIPLEVDRSEQTWFREDEEPIQFQENHTYRYTMAEAPPAMPILRLTDMTANPPQVWDYGIPN